MQIIKSLIKMFKPQKLILPILNFLKPHHINTTHTCIEKEIRSRMMG